MGAAAGAVTGLVTTPLDVLKTRLMVQGTSGQYKGVVDCAAQIVKQEGWPALFRCARAVGGVHLRGAARLPLLRRPG